MSSRSVLTFDIDWAPDWMILDVANLLLAKQVKATFFVTHSSPAIKQLQDNPLFELGIHPNCLANSTHGHDPRSVLKHICSIVPQAKCMRTHGLFQSTNFLFMCATEFQIEIDCSMFLPHAENVEAHKLYRENSSIWRIPFIFEDDCEMFEPNPAWDISQYNFDAPGLKVFNFHPVHVAMNFSTYNDYEKLKAVKPLSTWDVSDVSENFGKRPGPRNLLIQLIDRLGSQSSVLSNLVS